MRLYIYILFFLVMGLLSMFGESYKGVVLQPIGYKSVVPFQDYTYIKLYPNPVYDVAFVESNTNLSKVVVMNTLGKVLVTVEVSGNKKEIILDLGHLSKGMYFIKYYGERNELLKTNKLLKYENLS